MMRLQDYLKFKSRDELPMQVYPALSDHLLTLSNVLERERLSRKVLGIVGLYPYLKTVRPVETTSFVMFSTSRTAYAALRDVEDVFADFYLRSGILPYVNPMPKSFFVNPESLSRRLLRTFSRQGALVYGTEE